MYRVSTAAALIMLAAAPALAQQRDRDAFDDWRAPPPRYIERYRPPHEPDVPSRSDYDRRGGPPPGSWQVSPRDWREAERIYGYRPSPGWPPQGREPYPRAERERHYDRPDDHAGRWPPSPRDGSPFAPRPAHLDRAPLPPPEPRRLDAERRPVEPPAPLYSPDEEHEQPRGQKVMSGGPRPPVTPLQPERVHFTSKYAPGTIIIETAARHLLLVASRREALRYPISVGRIGFQWTGTERIKRMADWPDWHPPASMRQREPYLPLKMTGGIRNPLGAKALYLGNSLYRIHGTNDARTIGLASSSGCFRMLNGHVVDLAGRVRVGTTVVVVDRLPRAVGGGG